MLAQVGQLQNLCHQGREVLLVDASLIRSFELVGLQHCAPVALQGSEDGDVKGLKLIRGVGRQAAEGDVVQSAGINHIHRNVTGKVVTDYHLSARKASQTGQQHLKKPLPELAGIKPSGF